MTIVKNTTHVEDALSNRIEQFKGKQNFSDLITAYVDQVQDIENALFQILDDTNLDTAVGQQLDNLGQIVGEDRSGRDDETYRTALRVRILVNKSAGTIENVIEIAEVLTQTSGTVILTDTPPASFTLLINTPLLSSPEAAIALLDAAKAAGVGFQLHYFLSDESEIFRFASGDALEVSATQGFGNDGQTTGGKMSDVIQAGE